MTTGSNVYNGGFAGKYVASNAEISGTNVISTRININGPTESGKTASGVYAGGFAGEVSSATTDPTKLETIVITPNIIISGNLKESYFGGFAGNVNNAILSQLATAGKIEVIKENTDTPEIEEGKVTNSYFGGIVGKGDNFTLDQSYSNTEIIIPTKDSSNNTINTTKNYVGGLIGQVNSTTGITSISNSYFAGSFDYDLANVGPVNASIEDATTGGVNANASFIGGLIGNLNNAGGSFDMDYCYSLATIPTVSNYL